MGANSSNESRERKLLAELQHRVRNTLATMRVITRRSAETSDNLQDYVAHLDGRLAALARVQNNIIRDPLAGIDLGLLLTDEITSAALGRSTQVRADGPTLLLHPRTGEPFALAFHELMTNAIKFGALSVPEGRLAVSWRVETDSSGPQQLAFEWIETGVYLAGAGQPRRGFGTTVLQDMLSHSLGAHATMSFTSTGFKCRIVMPLTERVLPSSVPKPIPTA